MKFSSFNLKPTILERLHEKSFENSTPIQEQTIPLALAKQDLVACAKTGSGKTLAFVLPLIHLLSEEGTLCPEKTIRSLVLVPTRELAIQIYKEALYFSKGLTINLANAYGGQDYEKQKKKVQGGVDLLVATPGRLLDFYRSKDLLLEKIKYIVLDEADRMLDMGFIDDVKTILNPIKRIESMSLWSATMDYNVFYSMWSYMHEPEEILINPEWVDKNKVSQGVLHLGSDEKLAYALDYCKRLTGESLIIFTNTRDMVDILANALTQYGVAAKGLSSVINQRRRLTILEGFKEKKFDVLVATDLASRGIHVDDISIVINYDVPQDPESYVHRIGRTARAGKKGTSLLVCCERDYELLEKIENYLSYKIPILKPEVEIIAQLSMIKKKVRPSRHRQLKNHNLTRQSVKQARSMNQSKTKTNSHKHSGSLDQKPNKRVSNERNQKTGNTKFRSSNNKLNKPPPGYLKEDFHEDYPAGNSNQRGQQKFKKTKQAILSSIKKIFLSIQR